MHKRFLLGLTASILVVTIGLVGSWALRKSAHLVSALNIRLNNIESALISLETNTSINTSNASTATASATAAQTTAGKTLAASLSGDFIGLNLAGAARPVYIQRADNEPLTPVSLAKISPDLWLIANYRQVYAYNPLSGTARPAAIAGLSIDKWNPTALHYSTFYNRLFIANYTGGDVIEAEILRGEGNIGLRIVQRIVHPEGIVGPEGVFVSRGGRHMAVADYNGNAVSLFERVDNRWVFRWRRSMVASHGVTIVGDYVYASGTSIAMFELQTGNEVKRITSIGTHPILFATCIGYDESTGDLIGSDTMSGLVFTLTRQLDLRSKIGSNGPTNSNFSMPYCAYRDRDSLTIISTYQSRIIEHDSAGSRSHEFTSQAWHYIATPILYSSEMWRGTVRDDHPRHRILDLLIRPNYGSLVAEDGTTLQLPNRSSVFSASWPFYIVSVAEDGDWLALTSNSSPAVLLYQKSTGRLGTSVVGEWDCWSDATTVLCPRRAYQLHALAQNAKFASTSNDINAIARSLGISTGALLDEFSSPEGKRLREAVERNTDLINAATQYLASVRGTSIPLVEYWLATRLSRGGAS